jgi:5-methylcytosine-specific restriction endonuclease McrA
MKHIGRRQIERALAREAPEPFDWDRFERKNAVYAASAHCGYCGIWLHRCDATLDHLIPISRGGPDVVENVVTACRDCNDAKGHQLPLNYIWSRIELPEPTEATA